MCLPYYYSVSWHNGILSLNYCITVGLCSRVVRGIMKNLVDIKIIAEAHTVHGYVWTICRGIVIHCIIYVLLE